MRVKQDVYKRQSQPSVIYQNTQPISTQADPVASSSGQAMTPEQLYAANVDACVGITVSTTMTNIFGYTSTSAASGSGFVSTADGYIVTNYHVIEDAVKDLSLIHIYMCIRDSRSQVYVKAQIQQKGGLVQGVGPDGLQPSGSEEGLGGAELLRPEGGVVAVAYTQLAPTPTGR